MGWSSATSMIAGHNNAGMNLAVKQAAKALIKDGKYDQGILNTVEMTIRAYDP